MNEKISNKSFNSCVYIILIVGVSALIIGKYLKGREPNVTLINSPSTNNNSKVKENEFTNYQRKLKDVMALFHTKTSKRKNLDIIGNKCINDKEHMPVDFRCNISFLSNYRNPCWLDETQHKIRCLPYFMIIGMPKCGSTDLYNRLLIHPTIIGPGTRDWEIDENKIKFDKNENRWNIARWKYKAPHWWAVYLCFSKLNLDWYINLFQKAADIISNKTNYGYHNLVTVDSSTSTGFGNSCWNRDKSNDGLSEPKRLTINYVHDLLPGSKLIMIIRHPVERVYSEYLYFHEHENEAAPKLFHQSVQKGIDKWKKCLLSDPFRACLYDNSSAILWRNPIVRGLYVYFIEDVLKAYPPDQFALVLFEEYVANTTEIILKLYDFLRLEHLPFELKEVLKSSNVQNKNKEKIPMLQSTRTILNEFYQDSMIELIKNLNYPKLGQLWNISAPIKFENSTTFPSLITP